MHRLLDLYCCEGGASEGYRRAGFTPYGVDRFDKNTQARYPFPSHQGGALEAMQTLLSGYGLAFTHKTGRVEVLTLADFSAVVGSPPCQKRSRGNRAGNQRDRHEDLIPATREAFRATGLPYIIENVPTDKSQEPLHNPLTLCGTEYRLTARDADGTRLYLRRHREFESDIFLYGNGGCSCVAYKRAGWKCGGVYGGGSTDRQRAEEIRHGGYTPSKQVQEQLLGIDWMTRAGLRQAIPPAYTAHLGAQLLDYVNATQEGAA